MNITLNYDDVQHYLVRMKEIEQSISKNIDTDCEAFQVIASNLLGTDGNYNISAILQSYIQEVLTKKNDIVSALNILHDNLERAANNYANVTRTETTNLDSLERDIAAIAGNN